MEPIGFNEDWTADVVRQMHKYRISNPQLAAACGYSAAYVSTVLNRADGSTGEETKKCVIDSLNWRIEVAKELNKQQLTECELVKKLADKYDRDPEVFTAVLGGSHPRKSLDGNEERAQIMDLILKALSEGLENEDKN